MKSIEIRESVAMAFAALRANRLRATLTLLGVIIGVFSFIGVMTGIAVLQETITSSFNILGSNTMLVQKYPAIHTGPGSRSQYRNRKDITIAQGMYIRKYALIPEYIAITVGKGGGQAVYKNRKTNPNISIRGGTPEIFQTFNITVADGRSFNEQDVQYGRPVAVLGPAVVKFLFPNEDPLDKKIRLDGKEYRVIGLATQRGGLGGNADNYIMLPLTTFSNQYGKSRRTSIQAKAPDQASYDAMVDEVIGLLRAVRHVPPGEENDFEVVSNDSLISQVNDLTFLIRVGTGAVSAIALLAAGIGIMNIMLVSVTERTREIGVRKAVGATRRTILQQFLIEAIAICQLGGLIGVILGLGGGNFVAVLLEIPPVLPVGWAVLGLLVTTFVGIAFGVYPAWKAANLDPIEALRYE